MNTKFKKILSGATVVATLGATLLAMSPALAASMTAMSDTMTRLKISETADHTILFTLPSTITLDSSTNTDIIRVDFPATFSQSGTWVTGDFSFNDGTARTIDAVAQGSGTIDCTVASGVDNVCVAIDTTNHIFSIKPSDTYTASGAAATVTFTIDGTTTDGTLTNPGSAASTSIALAMCDETASCTTSFTSSHTGTFAVSIVDDDQVTVTASVDPSITFDIDTQSGACADAGPAYSVAFGSIALTGESGVKTSGATDSVNRICLDLATNAASGANVTVLSLNASLKSTSVPADTIPSASAAMVAGTANYGLCVVTAASGLTKASPFNGATCAIDGNTNDVGALSGSTQNVLTSTGPLAAGTSTIAASAAISTTTKSHPDYTDTLTFIATGTF